MLYYVLFVSLFFICLLGMFAHCGYYQTIRIEKLLFVYGFIILFVIAAIRKDTGFDYGSYENIFDIVHNTEIPLRNRIFNSKCEPGYNLFNLLFPNYRCLIIAISFLQVSLLGYYFYKENTNALLCLFMFYTSIFLYYDMGVMRQGLSIAISYCGLIFVKRKKFIKFILVILLAASFHITAIFMIPIYWLGENEFSRKVYYGSIFLSILFGMILNKIIIEIGNLNIPYISHRIEFYLANYTSTRIGYSLSAIKRIAIGVIFVEFFKYTPYRIIGDFNTRFKMTDSKSIKAKSDVWLYINSYILSLVMFIALSFIPIFGSRGSAGLYFLQIMVFARMCNNEKNRWGNIFIFLFVALMFFSTMRTTLTSTGNYIPYQSIL